jgi:hypothetical protein
MDQSNVVQLLNEINSTRRTCTCTVGTLETKFFCEGPDSSSLTFKRSHFEICVMSSVDTDWIIQNYELRTPHSKLEGHVLSEF